MVALAQVACCPTPRCRRLPTRTEVQGFRINKLGLSPCSHNQKGFCAAFRLVVWSAYRSIAAGLAVPAFPRNTCNINPTSPMWHADDYRGSSGGRGYDRGGASMSRQFLIVSRPNLLTTYLTLLTFPPSLLAGPSVGVLQRFFPRRLLLWL
jgi:hypothetical protein